MKTNATTIPAVKPGRTGTPAKPAPRYRRNAATSGGAPLSARQKAVISQTARAAFDFQDRAGLVDGFGSDSKRFEAWRRDQQAAAVGISSLRECGNNHYRTLMAHFLCLAGKDDSAFRLQVKTGRVKDHGAPEDTHENRETRRALILQALLDHAHRCDPAHAQHDPAAAAASASKGGIITSGYVITLAKAKCRGRSLDSLTATQLDQILYTIKNRIAAREGRGSSATRNKSQQRRTRHV